MTRTSIVTTIALAGCLMAPAASRAAGVEVAASGGGITMDGGAGTHGLFGASGAYRLTDSLQLFGEFSYTQLLSASVSENQGSTTATGSATLNQKSFGGGVDYSFGSSKKFVPYVLAAGGVAHYSVSATGTATNGSQNTSVNATVGVTNAAYAAFGGGVRMYAGKHWGLKTEARYQRYASSLFQANAVTYTAGLFFQFGGK